MYSRNTNAVTLLLQSGASVFIRNAAGDTAAEMARKLKINWLAGRLEEEVKDKEISEKSIFVRLYKDKASPSSLLFFGQPTKCLLLNS